jgi:alpha-galactosidase
MLQDWQNYCNVEYSEKYGPTVAYRTANFVFEEGLRGGRWVTLSYNAAGYMMETNPVSAPSWMDSKWLFRAPASFDAVVDGQSLTSHIECLGCIIERTDKGVTARVTLRHTVRPVDVVICTKLDGTPVLERWLEIVNRGENTAAVSVLAPLAGGAQVLNSQMFKLADRPSPYRVGYFKDDHSCSEGNFVWEELPSEIYTIAGRYRRDKHRHPMFVLENRVSGETFIGQFAWSGGYAFTFDYNNQRNLPATLQMRVDMDSPAPIRTIEPGEAWASPELHLGCVFGGLDEAVNAMHRHVRKSVAKPLAMGKCGWVQAAIGPEYDMSYESTMLAVEHAHTVGAELFWIDAAWYCEPFCENEWWNCAGDWHVNTNRYPDGLRSVREKCREYGLEFGLWFDAERVGPKSRAMREHPDWIERTYYGEPNGAGLLDLSNPECAAWVENELSTMIEQLDCTFFRLDWNVGANDILCCYEHGGYVENSYARHQQAFYAIFDRLRARFPNVVFENCAGGGGRTDLGMLRRFSETWITDWQLHPNAFRITNGMSVALPPEFINRLVGGQNSYMTGELQTQMRNLLFAYPSIAVVKPNYVEHNPGMLAEIRRNVEIYKNFVRPMLPDSDIFHHTPELPGAFATGYGVLELAAHDKSRGIIGVFRLAEADGDATVVYSRGADPAKTYRVTLDNTRSATEVSGFELANGGLRIRLPGALTSELVLFEAIG